MNEQTQGAMKTAEEWLESEFCEKESPNIGSFTVYGIEQIQLDAFKAGMTEAAEICGKDAILLKRPEEWGFLMQKKSEILAARDRKDLSLWNLTTKCGLGY